MSIARALYIVLVLSWTACGGRGEDENAVEEEENLELPPMSVGTIQAVGPHVFTSSLTVASEGDSSARLGDDRIELIWQDLEHYRLTRWRDGAVILEEYREGDILVFRRGAGAFRWGNATPGAEHLTDTITPFSTAIRDFFSELQVRELDAEEGFRRFALSVTRHEGDATNWQRRHFELGHSSLPLTLDGEVTVDQFANRIDARLEGTFRDRGSSGFDEAITELSYFETRIAAPEGVALQPPIGASPMLLERRALEATRVDTSERPPIR